MAKKADKKIDVCIGAFTESMYTQCKGKVDELKAAGFENAEIRADKYLYIIVGAYDSKEAAAEAIEALTKHGFCGYELA